MLRPSCYNFSRSRVTEEMEIRAKWLRKGKARKVKRERGRYGRKGWKSRGRRGKGMRNRDGGLGDDNGRGGGNEKSKERETNPKMLQMYANPKRWTRISSKRNNL